MPRFHCCGLLILVVELLYVLFQIVWLQKNRRSQILPRLWPSAHRPGFFRKFRCLRLQFQRFHHLSDKPVRQHHRGIPVTVRQFKRQHRQIRHFLHRRRRYHQVLVVAVAAALYHREVIALFRRDVSKSWSAAHHVDHHAGQFCTRQIRHALLHQTQSRPRRRRHHAHTRRCSAIHHVDRRYFTLCLQKCPAHLGQILSSGLRDFARRRDRIAVIRAAARQQRAFHDGDVSLTKLPHGFPPSSHRLPSAPS